MNSQTQHIGVVPLGTVPDKVTQVIAAHISGYLNLIPEVLPPMGNPNYALDKNRLQYDAGAIVEQLEEMPAAGIEKVVAVLDVDLFVPIFTHVFGEARQGGRAALISLFRLRQQTALPASTPSTVLERAAKIALHELCHLYSLSHCRDADCLMRFSGDIAELDRTPFYFCRYCAAFFRSAVAQFNSRKPIPPEMAQRLS
jgi:archaemetzincin